ncbi:MAG TPA: hypothetical protein VFL90_00550 [Methylomirabilota bacterium]|nr:hypothetical protein [Methylomirabilota bacterium]
MRDPDRPRSRHRLGALLLVAAAALLLQGAALPHTHAGATPGFYNQDHDLTLLATLHGAATLSAAQPALVVLVAVTAVTPLATGVAAPAPRRAADSRAPPRS